MAQLEVLYEIRQHATYVTCSERCVPGKGYAFDSFLSTLCGNPGISSLEYAKEIVKAYGKRYDGSPGSLLKKSHTLSAIDASKIGDVADAVDRFAKAMRAKYRTHDASFNSTVWFDVYKSWEADNSPYTDHFQMPQHIGVIRGDRKVLGEIARVLRPSGVFFCDYVNPDYVKNNWGDWAGEAFGTYCRETDSFQNGKQTLYSSDEWKSMLEDAGYAETLILGSIDMADTPHPLGRDDQYILVVARTPH